MIAPLFTNFFEGASDELDIKAILTGWKALAPHYDVNTWRLPLPLWAQRKYDDDGASAWTILRKDLHFSSVTKPMSIYVHIPFCRNKCGFCDSYSFKLGAHAQEHIERYVDSLCDELRLWSNTGCLNQRPISTIHLGGGTPAFIGTDALRRLVEACRKYYFTTSETEWALETTASSLSQEMISTLHELGFRRLHVGVQTLEGPVRIAIGRLCSPDEVIEKIKRARSLGWIVSVDLICGLPGQSLTGFLSGISNLIAAGTNGFSLYELLIYPQNRRWAERYDLTNRDHLPNYLLFQAGAAVLEYKHFKKNLFNHWADEQDANIYFTYPTRNEDCLAVGTIADGVFGNYHYRHPRYAGYIHNRTESFPGLEGGLRRNALEEHLQPFSTSILSGFVGEKIMHELISSLPGKQILDRWHNSHLLRDDERGGYILTGSGSWFAGNMIHDLKSAFY